MDVRCQGSASEARELSGGNLQKFVMAREIALKPKVLIVAQPTWGVDAGAAFTIRQELVRLRDDGVTILVISEELEELFEIADEFKTNVDRTYLGTIVPNTLGIVGTLFFGWGYAAAILFNAAFWVPQLAYVMRPLYKHKAQNRLPQRSH